MIILDRSQVSMLRGSKKWWASFTMPIICFKSETKIKTTLKRTKIVIFMLILLLRDFWISQWPKTVTIGKAQSPVPNPTVILFIYHRTKYSPWIGHWKCRYWRWLYGQAQRGKSSIRTFEHKEQPGHFGYIKWWKLKSWYHKGWSELIILLEVQDVRFERNRANKNL